MEESQQVHLSSLQALISLLLGVGPTIFLTTLELESRQVGMQVADEEERRKEKRLLHLHFLSACCIPFRLEDDDDSGPTRYNTTSYLLPICILPVVIEAKSEEKTRRNACWPRAV